MASVPVIAVTRAEEPIGRESSDGISRTGFSLSSKKPKTRRYDRSMTGFSLSYLLEIDSQ